MRAIEARLPRGKRWKPLRRPLALMLTLAAMTGMVTLAACVIKATPPQTTASRCLI